MERMRKIENFVTQSECPTKAKKKKHHRKVKFEELEKACYLSFSQQCSKGAPVSGPLLKEFLCKENHCLQTLH